MYGLRAVIPPKLRDEVCAHLRSAHQGVSQMNNRASECVLWPGITSDIQAARTRCSTCDINAPSQAKMPPADPFIPTTPFQAIASDYFQLQGKSYLLSVDRFSNWPDLRETTAHTPNAGAEGLIKANRELFATFGVPEQLSSDGGTEYTSNAFQAFLKTWGVKHRLSSAYHPQSNGRAEVTVKAMKRLLRDNVDRNGKLDTDTVTRAILQIRNTPESDSGLSPAQILLGRTLRDTLPLKPPIPRGTTVFDHDSTVSRVWKDAWSAKEHALKTRLARQVEKLEAGSHELKPLHVGDTVRVQNQTGNHPNKWDKTGIVVQVGDNDQYIVMVDGSRRLTLRNRRYLRKMIAPAPSTQLQPPAPLFAQPPVVQSPQLPAAQSPQPPATQSLQMPVAQSPQPPAAQSLQPPATQSPQPTAAQSLQPPATQSPQPPAAQSLQPAAQSPRPPVTTPVRQGPQQPDQQAARVPGRPKKQRVFNFMLNRQAIPSVELSTPLSSRMPSTMGDTTTLARSPPPTRIEQLPNSTGMRQRPQRVTKKPDWFGRE